MSTPASRAQAGMRQLGPGVVCGQIHSCKQTPLCVCTSASCCVLGRQRLSLLLCQHPCVRMQQGRACMHACQHTATAATPQCTHVHRDALLADGEQLKPCVGALARLGETVNLDSQVVTLGVPEDVDVCVQNTNSSSGGCNRCCESVFVCRATSRAAQSCCCCCPVTEKRETRCAALRRCLLRLRGQLEGPSHSPHAISLPGPTHR